MEYYSLDEKPLWAKHSRYMKLRGAYDEAERVFGGEDSGFDIQFLDNDVYEDLKDFLERINFEVAIWDGDLEYKVTVSLSGDNFYCVYNKNDDMIDSDGDSIEVSDIDGIITFIDEILFV